MVLDRPPQDDACVLWAWRKLPGPPFDFRYVTFYAVHPDGYIFVSIGGIVEDATFSISVGENIDESGMIWAQNGEWVLPFTGRVHYDSGLKAWVGFSGDPDKTGYLCACDVASVDSEECPAGKLSKENLLGGGPR
ncbi:hypothetical protein PR202_ga13232 [Eleusine coracana subsp. coracana]|uniref:Uncharacterized protein n=1 Tax=Eleusine coracana subsp. coracana TaxID=191504 RepID=A0AAV5CE51_ELECO|nr:hypothetical protein PR202_ga13232 [Eleusine coracana subsp. coracana]